MRVVGTAGHVDHGKSTLVHALTGIHPDRLKEEQAREMTIDLGFAWMNLPGYDQEIGIVDVPGHRDFIENMLAGVGGIDAVMFVVAADEGVMPQTREHLAILDLLQVPAGLIVLTKIDLVETEWLDLVGEDVRQAVSGTILQDAPILQVSSRTGAGLGELREELARMLLRCPPRLDHGRPRLPVDRVFTIAGFGTVVTGTLLDGQFKLGEEVCVYPNATLRGRVRGLQNHKVKVGSATQGSRVAMNISGVDVVDIRRGNVIAWPSSYQPTQRMDVHFRMLKEASHPLKHGAEVKFFLGSAEVAARARLIGNPAQDKMELVSPGVECWLQLELEVPVVAMRGDRYILRRPSPGETLGGGEVFDPHPRRRHKRNNPLVIEELESLRRGTPAQIMLQAWMKLGFAVISEGIAASHLPDETARLAVQELLESGELVSFDLDSRAASQVSDQADRTAIPAVLWRDLTLRFQTELGRYHAQFPLKKGMPREEIKSRLKISPRIFNAVLRRWVSDGKALEYGTLVALPEHAIRFSPTQQNTVERLMAAFRAAPYTPPSVKESKLICGEDVFNALVDLEELIALTEDVVFRKSDFDHLVKEIKAHFKREPTLTVAQFRDRFNTSRRYALAFLEYLDAKRMTVRDGDVRNINPDAFWPGD